MFPSSQQDILRQGEALAKQKSWYSLDQNCLLRGVEDSQPIKKEHLNWFLNQASLLISDLPTTLAVHAFREFAADHSTWIQVCGCMTLYLRVMKCRLGPNAIQITDSAVHDVFR